MPSTTFVSLSERLIQINEEICEHRRSKTGCKKTHARSGRRSAGIEDFLAGLKDQDRMGIWIWSSELALRPSMHQIGGVLLEKC